MKLILCSLILLSFARSDGAPYPMTSSSIFLNNKLNLFLWPFKIDLNLNKTAFEIDLSQSDQEKWSIKTLDPDIQISVRLRTLSPKEDYDRSLKSWIREYEKSGFQIKGQQIPQKNAESGWIHLQDPQGEKQLIQYFRYKNRTWVYFNCVGHKEKMTTLRQNCAKLSSILEFRAVNQ